MKILITGGAGYLGSVITNLGLQEGHVIKVIDTLWFNKSIPLIHISNPAYEFVRNDIRNSNAVKELLDGVDYIIHTAAVVGEPASNKFPELTYKINYEASLNLINQAEESGVKGIIFFSTCSNYGIHSGLAREETALKPLSLYAKSKVDIEEYLINKTKSVNWIICRLSTVYGISPRMRFDLTVNHFTMKGYLEKYLDIFLPYTYRPYIHVFDVAMIILAMIKNFDKVKNNIFNVGFSGENYQKIHIADIVRKFIPDVTIEVVKSGMDVRDYQIDFSKLNRYLNIQNQFTVHKGVKEIIDLLRFGIIEDPCENIYYNTKPDLGNTVEVGT